MLRKLTKSFFLSGSPICESYLNGTGCLWTVLYDIRSVTFKDGVNYCGSKRSHVAPINNYEEYYEALDILWKKMSTSTTKLNVMSAWINGTFYPSVRSLITFRNLDAKFAQRNPLKFEN